MAHVERIMYVELKKDFNDDGPAWIGRVRFSKTARTAYYRGSNLCRHNGMAGNYIDVATLEELLGLGRKEGPDKTAIGPEGDPSTSIPTSAKNICG